MFNCIADRGLHSASVSKNIIIADNNWIPFFPNWVTLMNNVNLAIGRVIVWMNG